LRQADVILSTDPTPVGGPSTSSSVAPTGTVGRYRIIERVGAGGFGSVFKAVDPDSNLPVAIKTCTLGEDGHERFFHEARLAAGLKHPRITAVYESGMAGDTPYMVQELLGGRDLSAIIAEREPLSFDAKRAILAGIADGLAFAHAKGVIHRDIKPSNVRVLEDGSVKIMDFGIAKSLNASTGITKSGVALGSMGYMSPEQVCGDAVGPWTDIFLLGVLAYEFLGYRAPFRNDNLFRLMELIVKEDPDPLIDVAPSVPPDLAAIVEKAMRKTPEDRFSSAAELRDALLQGAP
jgi:serine/threonine-protein kinase